MTFRKLMMKTGGVLFYLVQYGCVAHCAIEYFGEFVVCNGPSMEPTIFSNNVVVAEHFTVMYKQLQKGDIVIAKSPASPHQYVCKRVVAMEGDKVFNDKDSMSRYVPKGHVWLQGDNVQNSSDSRNYGPVPYGLLRSRVFYKIWPIREIGRLGVFDDYRER